ncbi:MAG TPA: hypothetical protein PKD55_18760 [Bellilinea sp.]|nr:hypothetical protein [Bellilinea sp.]
MKLYQVTLFPEVAADFPYLLDGLAQVHTLQSGDTVVHITATAVDASGPYLALDVSAPPNGEPKRVLLNHSFVAAILELTNQQTPPGFVSPSESL